MSIFIFIFIKNKQSNKIIPPPDNILNLIDNNKIEDKQKDLINKDKTENEQKNLINKNKTNQKNNTGDDKYYYGLAKSSLDYSNCENITSTISKNICYQQIALSLNEKKICEYINDTEKKSRCIELIKTDEIKKNGDISKCNILNDPTLQITCVKNTILNNKQTDCSEIKNEKLKEYCNAENYFNMAKNTNDSEYCQKINTGIIRANCFSLIEKKDLFSDDDNDGINYKDEIIKGINPDMADTDGDGFNDGDEINQGYNPAGTGKIDSGNYLNKIMCEDIEDDDLQSLCFYSVPEGFIDLLNCQLLKQNIDLYNYCMSKGVWY